MTKALASVAVGTVLLAACGGGPPPAPPAPDTVIRVDTVVITREVPPPLPDGRPATLCLATGQNIDIRITEAGDTLVGPRRARMADMRPAVGFVGNYAGGEAWFVNDEPITFDRRTFSRFGQPDVRDCRGIKIVGEFRGVNLFTEAAATAPFEILYVPVRPGVFQPYRAQVGRVRG